jgi:beta-lactamase superfamily II metal-dependent hydrolase
MALPSRTELASAPLSVVVFGPGFGESIVIRIDADPEPLWAVVDSARRQRSGVAVNPAQELLSTHEVAPELVVLTHSHLDHCGGMAEIVANLRPGAIVACVQPLITSPSPHTPIEDPDDAVAVQRSQAELTHTAIIEAWRRGIVKWSTVHPTSLSLGGWSFSVLHPDEGVVTEAVQRSSAGLRLRLNDLSASLLIERDDIALVLGADSEQAAWSAVEARLTPAGLWHTRPVKASHHGSTNGIHPVLIDELTLNGGRDHIVTPFPSSGRLPRFDRREGAERLVNAVGRLQLTALPVDLVPIGGPVTLAAVRDALVVEHFDGDDAFDIRLEESRGAQGLKAGVRDPLETWVALGVHLDGRIVVTRGAHAVELWP